MSRLLLELALFLTPFAVFFLYRSLTEGVSVRDRWPITTLVMIGAALAIAALVIAPLRSPSAGGQCYQAQRYENGVTIPGRMVDCSEIEARQAPPATPTTPPVAPRDERR
ncbi:hypothetical protein GC169_12590 [bacterium]|nr:hypothetical protein [bacterium]